MKKALFFLLLIAAIGSTEKLSAQGCVAIRSNGGFCTAGGEHKVDTSSAWQLSINNQIGRAHV